MTILNATKVAVAGTIALTGVFGASLVGVSQGETALNQAQAAEVTNESVTVGGVTDISFTKQQDRLQTHSVFNAQLNFTITEDVEHGVFKALILEGKTATSNGEKDALYINGKSDVVVDGEVIGERTGKRIVFNENVHNHVGKEVTVDMKPGVSPAVLADTRGVYELPVQFKLNNQTFGEDTYNVNVTKVTTKQSSIDNATKRGVTTGTPVGTIDGNNNYKFNNTMAIGADFFQENDRLTVTVDIPEGVTLSNIPAVGQELNLLHGSVDNFGSKINGTELTFLEQDQYVFNLNVNRVSEDKVVYTYVKNNKFNENVKGGIYLKSLRYTVDEGAYTTKENGKYLRGTLTEGVKISAPEAGYSTVSKGGNIK